MMKMETPHSANCPKFLENLIRLVDMDMTQEEEKAFLESIEVSVECLERVEIERAYKEFLAVKLERKNCSPELIQSIRNCIKDHID